MELGATVCKPGNPLCSDCPVAGVCAAAHLVSAHLASLGDPQADGAPQVTHYPEKVGEGGGGWSTGGWGRGLV